MSNIDSNPPNYSRYLSRSRSPVSSTVSSSSHDSRRGPVRTNGRRSRSRSRRRSSHISSSRHDIRRGPVHASGRSSSRSCSPVRTNGRSSRSLTVPPAPTVTG